MLKCHLFGAGKCDCACRANLFTHTFKCIDDHLVECVRIHSRKSSIVAYFLGKLCRIVRIKTVMFCLLLNKPSQTFQNLAELRTLLVRDMGDQFVKNLAENLLTYALGRGVEYSDKPTVEEIMRKAKATGYRFQDLILAVCESVPFQKMRVTPKAAQ